MSDIDFEKVAADMVDILGIDTIMKYFIYRAEADLENSRRCLNLKTYLLLDQSSGYCKIGKTSDITKRIQALSCGNPDIELLFTIDDDVEELLQKRTKTKESKENGLLFHPKIYQISEESGARNTHLLF